jgi:mannosyltransferase
LVRLVAVRAIEESGAREARGGRAEPGPGWVVPVGPAVVRVLLGCWGLTRQGSMWRDEAATWQGAHRTVPELWRMLGEVDAVHGLYYLLMHGVFAVAPDTLLSLRVPSVLAMAAAAAGTASLGRRLAGPWAGLTAGLVFAAIPSSQHYAQEGRSYALVVAAVVWASLLLLDALGARRRARRLWTAYALTMLVAVLLNEFAALALLAHGVTVVRAARTALLRWLAAASGVALGSLPLLLVSLGQRDQVSWIGPPSGARLASIAGMVLVGCLSAAAVGSRSVRGALLAFALPLLAVPQSLLILASLTWQPLYVDRYVLYGNVGFALLLGAGADRLVRTGPLRTARGGRDWPLVAVPLLALVVLLPVERSLRQWDSRVDDVLAAALEVNKRDGPGGAVVFLPAARRDTALTEPDAFRGLRDVTLARSGPDSGTLRGLEASPARIRAALLRESRIVVVSDLGAERHRGGAGRDVAKRQVLASHFTLCDEIRVRGRHVAVYERGTVCGGRS